MSEAMQEVRINEMGYFEPTMTSTQINNIKNLWKTKRASDVTPAVKAMIKKMDVPTQLAIKHAGINHLSKLVEDVLTEGRMSDIDAMVKAGKSATEIAKELKLDVKVVKGILGEEDKESPQDMIDAKKLKEGFNASQIERLKKEYEVLRGKKISVQNANKLSAMFKNIPDSGLIDIYKADIPFLSVMAMSKMVQKNIPRPAGVKLSLEEVEELEDVLLENLEITEGKISGAKFDTMKKGDSLTITYNSVMSGTTVKKFIVKGKSRSNKYNTDKITMFPDGNPGMARFFLYKRPNGEVSLATGDMAASIMTVKENFQDWAEAADDAVKLKNQNDQKDNEIARLKQKAETDKAKNVQKSTQKMVNPETGEPLLQVGIAYKHLKDKMAKDAASKDDAEEKEKQNKKELVAKFKDRIRESLNLDESDASDKAKGMGLTYMKFGRYGKDGKVTHKSIGGNLTAVDKNEKPIKEPKSDKPKDEPKKDEPKAEPKPALDTFQAQKDLQDMVTDGMIDVEDDGQGGVNMTKEYEPSQDYEAEQDVKAIKDYLKDKGIDEKDILVDVESEEEYIQINVEVRGKKMDESTSKFTSQQIKMAYGIANDKRYKGGNMTGAIKAIEKIAKGLSSHPDVQNVLKRTNEDLNEFKKMTVSFNSHADMSKASTDLAKQGFTITGNQKALKIDGNGADLNKYATDLKNFYGATVRAESYSIDESADDDNYDPITEACWVGYTQKGMKKKGDKMVPNCVPESTVRKEQANHPAKELVEKIEGLKNKSEKSGMPYGILKKVYDRGMAAWRGGHRPGTTQQQWAFARVNSFITKSSGTWGGADKDLAKQVKSESLEEASLYAFKEYEPSQSYEASRDMKNVEDAIKRAGGRIKSKEKPTRREPNASFEIETGNPNAVKAAIKKADPEFNVD